MASGIPLPAARNASLPFSRESAPATSGVYRADAREASAAGSVFLVGRGRVLFQLIELLFERLAASWTISGLEMIRQKELIGRYRMASGPEREFVLESLRAHAAEHFPDVEAP